MEINLNTPALLFPAISLLLLAYTNRFVALANLVRKLHDEYKRGEKNKVLEGQIHNLRQRINYIRYMQGLGVFSFLLCVVCMFLIYNEWFAAAKVTFAFSLVCLGASLVISLLEIIRSMNALELELGDMEGMDNPNLFMDLLGRKKEGK